MRFSGKTREAIEAELDGMTLDEVIRAFEERTPEAICAEMLAELKTEVEVREGSYTYDVVSAVALEMYRMSKAALSLVPMFYVDETSGSWIDVQGGYFGVSRKSGSRSAALLQAAGRDGIKIPLGTTFLSGDGLEFISDADAVVQDGAADVPVKARDVGEKYNLPAGAIVRMFRNISGVEAVTNLQPSEGGADPESDPSLFKRLDGKRKRPATSGNIHHYEEWAREVAGVGAAKIIPRWNGGGTVKVLIASDGLLPVDAAVVAACVAHIGEQQPALAEVTVESVAGVAVDVAATVFTDGSVSAELVKYAFTARLEDYLHTVAVDGGAVVCNRLGHLLLAVEGVVDYDGLTVNGSVENLPIAVHEVPIAGEVVFREPD